MSILRPEVPHVVSERYRPERRRGLCNRHETRERQRSQSIGTAECAVFRVRLGVPSVAMFRVNISFRRIMGSMTDAMTSERVSIDVEDAIR
jgi:hypothetical protein